MIELQAPAWWEDLPTLQSSNVELREVHVTDAPALLELLTNPRVRRFISAPPSSLALFEGFIAWARHERRSAHHACFVVVPHGLHQAAGIFQIRATNAEFTTAEWGFVLHEAFWSTGMFVEAAVKVLEFAFGTIGVQRLEARTMIANGRGNRALEKVGATGEAMLRRAFDCAHSQFLWSILAHEWTVPDVTAKQPFDAARLRKQITQRIAEYQTVPAARDQGSVQPRPFPFFVTDLTDEGTP